MAIPQVAIIGRANVGKSTLFNRITRTRSAIVNNTSGVTRDRMYSRVETFDKPFVLIDTGGIDVDSQDEIEVQIKEQALFALESSSIILFMVDGKEGLQPQDHEVIQLLRKSEKDFFLVVNKLDRNDFEDGFLEFTQLGVERTFAISAEHGNGVVSLMETVVDLLSEFTELDEAEESVRVAIIGKPNAGKSSLINKILNKKRCIVSPIPGTTRDAVDSPLISEGKHYILIDTAGIRKKGKTRQLLDKFSVIMALKAMERADVVVLLLDAKTGVTDQDATIAGYAYERGRACLIVANKWDLIENKEEHYSFLLDQIKNRLKFLDFAPILTISSKTGQGIHKLFPKIQEVYKEYSRQVPTGQLNSCFERAVRKNPMSLFRGKFLKLYYTTQVKNRPPTFRCFVNYPKGIHFSYQRYLANTLRKTFGFTGTPVRLIFSPRSSQE